MGRPTAVTAGRLRAIRRQSDWTPVHKILKQKGKTNRTEKRELLRTKALFHFCPDTGFLTVCGGGGGGRRDALEGKGPRRRSQKRLDGRLEEVAKAVGGGYCRLQMPLRLALGVRGTVAGHRLGALEGGGGVPPPMHPLGGGGGCTPKIGAASPSTAAGQTLAEGPSICFRLQRLRSLSTFTSRAAACCEWKSCSSSSARLPP